MPGLILDVRLDGFEVPAGQLLRTDTGALTFTYSAPHLKAAHASPLSLSLPLTYEPFGDVPTRAFFSNLLQERDDALASLMAREGLSRDDTAGLLLHLGKDCAGALSVLPHGAPPAKVPGDLEHDYVELSEDRLVAIVTALHKRRRLPDGTQDPSPLAGVQSKIALTLLPGRGLAEPRHGSGAPTTHILKVPGPEHTADAALEALTLNFSRNAGLETARADVVSIGGIEALLVERFDRTLDDAGRVIRLHQEDFAQALGLPAELKYERYGKAGRKFDAHQIKILIDNTIEPAASRNVFIQATLFDLLTGNCDAHAKNHALMHLGGGRVRLAPRYDLLPTRLDPALTDLLPFKIGAATRLAGIRSEDFDAFLSILGFASAAGRRRVSADLSSTLARGLASELPQLEARSMKRYADLIAANMRQLLPVLGAQVPPAAQNRDAYVASGGGWDNI